MLKDHMWYVRMTPETWKLFETFAPAVAAQSALTPKAKCGTWANGISFCEPKIAGLRKFWGGLQRGGTGGWARHASDVGQQLKASKSHVASQTAALTCTHMQARKAARWLSLDQRSFCPSSLFWRLKIFWAPLRRRDLPPHAIHCSVQPPCSATKNMDWSKGFNATVNSSVVHLFSPFFHLFCVYLSSIWASQVRCIFPVAWQKAQSLGWWSHKNSLKTSEKSWRVCVTRPGGTC